MIKKEEIYKIAEKLLELINNENLRKSMSENAKKNAKKYRIDNITNQWKNLFENLLVEN